MRREGNTLISSPSAEFEAQRAKLIGLAYRLLGTMSDAEDVVQDAWFRWRRTARSAVERPQAYLTTIVTRLCLDHLKHARHRREVYVGPWLPEPVLEDPALATSHEPVVASDVSFALLLALERLSPLERAAFILHDVFDLEFSEVAQAIGRTEAACRQLARRARDNIRAERPRFVVQPEESETIAKAFFAASLSGDADTLGRLLADSVALHTDGGGRKAAALNVISGAHKVARFFVGLARKRASPPLWSKHTFLNGLPATLIVDPYGTRQATAVETGDGQVQAIYVIRNPDKLERLWTRIAAVQGVGEAGADRGSSRTF